MNISYEQQDALSEKYQDLEIFFHSGYLDVNKPRVNWESPARRFYTIRIVELEFEDIEKLLELFDELFQFSKLGFAEVANNLDEFEGVYNLTITGQHSSLKHKNNAKAIRSILEKDWSIEHKLFTLLCAAQIGSEVSTERILYLAEKLASSTWEYSFTREFIDLYLIPALFSSSLSSLEYSNEELISAYNSPDLEMLIEFIHSGNDLNSGSTVMTLEEHSDSFKIAESIPTVSHITINVLLIVNRLLDSEYFEEVLKMTPKVLLSFSSIIAGHTHIKYPVEPLISRAKAMNGHVLSYTSIGNKTPINFFLYEYCNQREIEVLRQPNVRSDFIKFDNLREELVKNKVAMSCILEIAVVRGPQIALEVLEFIGDNWRASSLSDVTTKRGAESAEAYVDLICDPLKIENYDFPFAWLAALHPRTAKV